MADGAVDGVIKYRHRRVAGGVEVPVDLVALNDARTALFDLGLIGVDAQGVGYGNVSVRGQGDQFVISASATGAARLLPLRHYCQVMAFSVDDNEVTSRGLRAASSESLTHGAIYGADARVRCVVHVHSRRLFAALLGANALHTPANVAYGTPAMARAVTALVRAQRHLPVVFAMAGHQDGVVAYGVDVASVQTALVDAFHQSTSSEQTT